MEEDVFDKREYTGLSSGSIDKLVDNLAKNYVQDKEAEFGGLSPDEFKKLVLNNWSGPDSPVVFNYDLPEEEAGEVQIVKNADTFLQIAQEKEGLKVSEDGMIELETVYDLMEEMDFGPHTITNPSEIRDVGDETEARPLHILRVVLEVAELLQADGGFFRPTERGESFMEAGKKVDLLEHLFVTYFRVFNLAYYTRGGELAEIQGLFPYSLYMMDQIESEGEWINRKELVNELIPPPLKEGSDEKRLEFLAVIYSGRVLDPLTKFGLLEARGFGEEGLFQINSEYHKMDLFDRFISFNV